MKVIIENHAGEKRRATLPPQTWEGRVERGTEVRPGRFLTGLYYGPRTRRAVVREYSIWDRGDGQHYGEAFREVSTAEFLAVAAKLGARLPAALDRAE